MFFGPYLPIVPLMILLEYLPESIGTPLQTAVIDVTTGVIGAFSEVFGFIFPFLY